MKFGLPKLFNRRKSQKLNAKEKSKRQRKLTRSDNKKKLKLESKQKQILKSREILKSSFIQIKENKRIFIGISIVYIALTVFFVQGVNGAFPLKTIQDSVDSAYGTELNPWAKASASYGLLVTSGTSVATELESVYQTIIVLIVSLAILSAIRLTFKTPKKIKLSKTFYGSTSQLIPLLMVLVVAMIQLVPFGIGSTLFGFVNESGIAVTGPEQIFWYGVLLASMLISAWLLIPTIFSMYIVTLPDASPIKSIKQGFSLVRFNRLKISFRILVLVICGLVLSAGVLIPLIVVFPTGAEVTYLLFSCGFMIFAHTYVYRLYRSII